MNEVLIMTNKNLIQIAVEKFSKENKVLLVLDFSGCCDEDKAKYIKSIEAANILTAEQIKNTLEKGALLIVIPYFSTTIASNDYQKLKHARHFASLWVDGEKYAVDCN